MKIAICINRSSDGGVGTSTYILASGMRKAGHQADILATDGQIGSDYERALRDGWPVEAIGVGERWLRRRLEITLERLSAYDVVINNHSIETRLLFPALPKHIVRLSVIRSTDAPVIEQGRLNSRFLDTLVGISPQVSGLLEKAEVECPVHTIGNAVILRNDVLPSFSLPLRILFVGRIEERQKNILILPEIACVLANRGLQFTLTIVGDGPHRRELEERIERLGVGQFMRLLGELPREKVWDMFRESHFTILPSNFEGFGLVVAEAMAAGSIPIVSDIPVFRWILGDDAETLQAPINDVQAYADRLCAIAEDPERYRLLQQRLHQRQRENFTPEVTVNGYLSLLTRLKAKHNEDNFTPIALTKLDLPSYYRRRCTRVWWLLQKYRYGLHDYQMKRKAQ